MLGNILFLSSANCRTQQTRGFVKGEASKKFYEGKFFWSTLDKFRHPLYNWQAEEKKNTTDTLPGAEEKRIQLSYPIIEQKTDFVINDYLKGLFISKSLVHLDSYIKIPSNDGRKNLL